MNIEKTDQSAWEVELVQLIDACVGASNGLRMAQLRKLIIAHIDARRTTDALELQSPPIGPGCCGGKPDCDTLEQFAAGVAPTPGDNDGQE